MVSVHRDLSCLRLSFWSRAKNSPEMRSAKKCPEISATVPDIQNIVNAVDKVMHENAESSRN